MPAGPESTVYEIAPVEFEVAFNAIGATPNVWLETDNMSVGAGDATTLIVVVDELLGAQLLSPR